ncbi:MAG TPA: hypothetical protein VIK61_08195, partial [Acidimicrobiia bacterium]
MATFRKALEYLGLVDADDEYADDGYYDDEYVDEEPVAVAARTRSHAVAHAPEPVGPVTVVRPVPREAPSDSATTNRPAVVRTLAAKVHVMDPEGFNDAQDVGDRLKA